MAESGEETQWSQMVETPNSRRMCQQWSLSDDPVGLNASSVPRRWRKPSLPSQQVTGTESPNRNKMGLYLIGCPIMANFRLNTYILGSTYRINRLVKTPFTVHTSLHKSFISLSLKPEQFNPLHLASHSPLRLASREDFISALIVHRVPNGSAPQYISDLLTRLHPGQVSSCSSARAFIVVPRIRSRSSEGGGGALATVFLYCWPEVYHCSVHVQNRSASMYCV